MAAPPIPRNTFLQRLIGAAALDAAIYEEVEADPGAIVQATIIVVVSSLASGVGATGFGGRISGAPFFAIAALMSWAAWALVVYEIGGRLMPEPQTRVGLGQLLRTIGFAATPGFISVLGFMRGLTVPVFIVASVWMVAAMVVAVRQALDYRSTAHAIGVCVLGWVLAVVLAIALGLLFAPAVS
jgi:hypothetical protein